MTPIIKYLRDEGTDHRGRYLLTILRWDDFYLEKGHDYIQWVFPSDIPSEHFEGAPVLTKEEMTIMANDELIHYHIRTAYHRFLKFYEPKNWITPFNHNFKRLTRILRCLWICGMKTEYYKLQEFLEKIYNEYPEIIGQKTLEFWKTANKDL